MSDKAYDVIIVGSGAGGGVVLAILLMNTIGTPSAVFWIALPILLAALLAGRGWLKLIPVVFVAGIVVLDGSAEALLEVKRQERAPVVYKHWDAMAKVKMYNYGGMYRGLNVDNVFNTPVVPFDGDWETFLADTTADHSWDIDVGYLIDKFDPCTFLSPRTSTRLARRTPAQVGNLREVVGRYAAATGFDLSDLPFYEAFSWWKQACIVEGVYGRRRAGTRGGTEETGRVSDIADRVDAMLDHARDLVRALD